MPSLTSRWTLPFVSLLLLSCGGAGKAKTTTVNLDDFECKDRSMSYTVVGGFAADESGVSMQCADTGAPTILKWRLDGGDRQEKTFPLSAQQFDDVWAKIDSTGWRHLDEECNNPDATPDDPAYTMKVGDHAMNVDLACAGKTLPFPFDRIVNELDLRAVGVGETQS